MRATMSSGAGGPMKMLMVIACTRYLVCSRSLFTILPDMEFCNKNLSSLGLTWKASAAVASG